MGVDTLKKSKALNSGKIKLAENGKCNSAYDIENEFYTLWNCCKLPGSFC